MKDVETTILAFVRFVLHRFDPACNPSDKQLRNALDDFRRSKS
jgi:hypothetical protein